MENDLFVIDTNVLLSAFLFTGSPPGLAYDKVKKLGNIPASLATYNELCEVLLRPKFNKYVALEIRLQIIKEIKELLVFLEIEEPVSVCRDPKDNKFLELAMQQKPAASSPAMMTCLP